MYNKRLRIVLSMALMVVLCKGMALAAGTTEVRIMARPTTVGNDVFFEALIETFKAIRPDLKLVWDPAWDHDKLTIMLISGSAPDIFETWGWRPVDWANSGLLLDLRPYVQRDLTAEDIKDFFPGDWEACFLRFGERKGEQYGMPRYTNTGVTYYNVNRLQEAGLADIYTVAQGGGWTFEAFREYARKLTVHDHEANVKKYGAQIEISGIQRLTGLVASFGGRMFSFNPLAYAFDEPQTVAALEFHQRLMYEDQVIPKRGDPAALKNFPSGAVALHLEGSGTVRLHRRAIDDSFPFLLAPWPAGPGGRVSWAAGDKYCVSRQTKDPDSTWEVLKYLTSVEGAMAHTRYLAYAPSRRSAMREYLRLYPEINAWAHAETANTARVFEESQIPDGSKISAIVNGALVRIWDGVIAPRVAFSEIKDQVNSLLVPFR